MLVLAPLCMAIDWPPPHQLPSPERATVAQRIEALEQSATALGGDAEGPLVQGLNDPDLAVRLAAVELVGRLRVRAAVPTLTPWLGDTRAEIRGAAAMALGAIGADSPLPALVRALGDADVGVRLAAVNALASIGSRDATIPLLGRVTDAESTVRVAAAVALGQMGDPRAVLSLLGALQDPIPEVRQAAAVALGHLRDARSLRGLASLLHDTNGEVRVTATRAIASLGPVIAQSAVPDLASLALREDRTSDPLSASAQSRAAVEALGRIGGEAACDALVQVFRSSDGDLALADAAVAELGRMPEARTRIAALTAQPFAMILIHPLLTLLGSIGGDEAAGALMTILSSWAIAPDARERGIRELGRTGSQAALMHLLSLCGLAHSVNAQRSTQSSRGGIISVSAGTLPPQNAALDGLLMWATAHGELDVNALDPLMDALRAPSPGGQTRMITLARLIGATRSPRAPGVLAGLLDSNDEALRSAAATALARAGVRGVGPRLVRALSDPSPTVRWQIAEALARHGDAETRDLLIARWNQSSPMDRSGALWALGRITARAPSAAASEILITVATQGAADQASLALDALSATAATDPAAQATIVSSLEVSSLRMSALEALGNAASPQQASPWEATLRRHVGSSSVWERAGAVWAMGRSGARAQAELVGLLADPSVPVAANAAGGLAEMFAARQGEPTSAHDALCETLQTRTHPAVRSNAMLALAAGGLSCPDLPLRRWLLESRSQWVRAAVATYARSLNGSGAEGFRAALEQCADEDTNVWVAARCRAGTSTTPASAVATSDRDRIDALVTDEGGRPAPDVAYGLVLPSGVIRLGRSGPGGWVHQVGTTPGRFFLLEAGSLTAE